MKTYIVTVVDKRVSQHYVSAESEEEARHIVEEMDYESLVSSTAFCSENTPGTEWYVDDIREHDE